MQDGPFDPQMLEQLQSFEDWNGLSPKEQLAHEELMQKILSDPELAQVCNLGT